MITEPTIDDTITAYMIIAGKNPREKENMISTETEKSAIHSDVVE